MMHNVSRTRGEYAHYLRRSQETKTVDSHTTWPNQFRHFFGRLDNVETDLDTLRQQESAVTLRFESEPEPSMAKLYSVVEQGVLLAKIHEGTNDLSDLNRLIEHF